MNSEKEIFKIFLQSLTKVLDEEITDPRKRSTIFSKILDNFNFELGLKVKASEYEKKS